MKKLSNFLSACQKELSYNQENKEEFHKHTKAILKETAKAAGLKAKISVNAGGIAVSGEVKLTTDKLEIWVLESMGKVKVLYRTRTPDGKSGNNQYIEPAKILDDNFIRILKNMQEA